MTQQRALWFLLIEGFVSVTVQFLVLRQLTPFVGSSVIITSLVITIFLAFMALGYRTGGKIRADHLQVLHRNLIQAALLLGLCVAYISIRFFFAAATNLSPSPLITLTVYLLLVVAPIAYKLSQTMPLLINFMQQEHSAEQAGDALFISTIGNVVGGLITTLVLMFYLGVAWSITIHSIILATLSLMLIPQWFRKISWIASWVFITALVVVINVGVEKLMFVRTTSYNNYGIAFEADEKNSRHFMVNSGYSSFIDDEYNAHSYIEHIRSLINERLPLEDASVLVLGAGGFTLSAKQHDIHRFTYVDIDPQIKDLAEQRFLFEPINGRFVAQDARGFLLETTEQWDVIVLDVYAHQRNIPWHLLTAEFFKLLQSKLATNGVTILNVIHDPLLRDHYSQGVHNTIMHAFKHCARETLPFTKHQANVIYTCLNDVEPYPYIYTDNTTRVSVDSYSR